MADDTFDPAEFSAFKTKDAAPSAPVSGFDPAEFEAAKKGAISVKPVSVADTLTEGAKGLARGAGNFVGDMGEAIAGPFGPSHHVANLMADLGLGERPAPEPTYGQQIAHASGTEANPESTSGKYASTMGEFLGNPASYFGPGGWLAKALMAGASGAGSEAAGEAAQGTKYEPAGRVAGALAAGPLAARAAKPQLAPAQQALADAGVTQMTPGQLIGGMPKTFEDKLTSIPLLGSFISNARGRSIESFNKAVGNQALAPIGEKLSPRTAAGHDAVTEVESKLGAAYDNLLPKLNFIPDRQYAQDLAQIRQRDVAILPQPQIDQYERILDTRLGPPAPMSGKMLKSIESELNHLGSNYASSGDAAQRGLGNALQDTVQAIRSNLERSNPTHAEELGNINSGWAMYARIRAAAANRATSEGVFTPGDLLSAVKRSDKSVGKGSFARGNALMQDFAEAGQKVLPSKIPTSGTSERAMAAATLGGGSYLLERPSIMAAGAAATVPYMTPSMYLLNRYVRPTTGARAAYSDAGRGVGTLRPFMETSPYGIGPSNPYSP